MGHPNPAIQFGITSASADGRFRSRYPAGDWPGIPGVASGAGKSSATTAAAATAAGNASASGAGKINSATAPAATAEGSGPGLFPLAVHASKRYLVTASGNPFLVHGDTPWSIAVQLTRTQIDTYLDNRAAKGFNAILFNVIEHHFSDNSPAYKNREGNNPFTSMTDFASPNEAYFELIDYIYNGCISRGIWPLMNPAYLGYEGGSEGWMSEVTAESAGDLQTYGAFLANRYPLAGWCFGGDYGGNSTQRNKQWNIVTGMRTVRTTDIITGHGARTQSAYSLWNGYTGFNLNNIYTDGTEYTYAATEYARSGPMPFILLEGYYDGSSATSADCRRQAYGSILSGACGDFFGDDPVWDFGSSSGSGGGVTSALTHLNDTSATQMSYLPPFFNDYDWHLLAPVTNTSLVTTSLGSGSSRIMPALASDGSFAMIWTPSANFTVDMSALSPSSVRARWFNPSAGTYADASGSPFSNTGTQSFTAPGERILVLDANPQSSFSHGDEVTITGSGFGGTMPTFKFAGGVAGQLETTSTGSTPSNNGNPVESEPTVPGTFSWRRFAAGSGFARQVEIVEDVTRGKSLGKSQTSGSNYVVSSEYTFNSSIPAGGKAYISYWIKASLTGSGGSAQFKLWRMMGVSDVNDTNTNLVGHFLSGSSNIHENPTGSNILMYGGSGNGYWNANGNWMRIEIKFLPGTQGNRNGKVLYRAFRGSSVPSDMSFSGDGYDIRTQSLSYPNSTRYSAFMWERWLGNGYSAVTWGEDDHYAQEGSFRRVELWNTNSPSTATIREIQEPTSWSSGSITIRLNKGGLSAGTYYLVVLDDSETDTVLASKQITVN